MGNFGGYAWNLCYFLVVSVSFEKLNFSLLLHQVVCPLLNLETSVLILQEVLTESFGWKKWSFELSTYNCFVVSNIFSSRAICVELVKFIVQVIQPSFVLRNFILLENTSRNQNIVIDLCLLASTFYGCVLLEQESIEVIFILLALNIKGKVGSLIHIYHIGFLIDSCGLTRCF